MPGFNDGWLGVPARPGKPRQIGLTHVMDKGLNIRDIEGMFDTAGDFVDIVKLGWGTSYVTNNLEKKIALYRHFQTPVVCGGTLFEAVYAKGKIDEFKAWLTEHRFAHVEISDGTIDIPRDEKLALIADFARDFTVLSEVGSKDSEVVYAPYQWVEWIKEELEAGSWKVITEAREGGTAGIFRKDGDMRTGPDRRDRARHRGRRRHLRGAHEGVAGLVREAVRPERQPGQHPARRGDPARDAAARPAWRHAQADPARDDGDRRVVDWKLSLAGLLIGLLVGMTGMGGGSLMTPMLILVFGFKPTVAIGTDILHGAIFKSFGAARHRQLGHVHARLALWMLIGSAPASLLGVALSSWLSKTVRRRLRERGPAGARDRARDRRHRVLRQGVHAPLGERRPVPAQAPRQGDRAR